MHSTININSKNVNYLNFTAKTVLFEINFKAVPYRKNRFITKKKNLNLSLNFKF